MDNLTTLADKTEYKEWLLEKAKEECKKCKYDCKLKNVKSHCLNYEEKKNEFSRHTFKYGR